MADHVFYSHTDAHTPPTTPIPPVPGGDGESSPAHVENADMCLAWRNMHAAWDAERTRLAEENARLREFQHTVMKMRALADKHVKEAHEHVRATREKLEREVQDMKRYQFERIVDLDVGGEHIRCYSALLAGAGGMLGAMFSGRHEPVLTAEGRHYIDFDGTLFRRVISYLRMQQSDVDDALQRGLDYFCIE